MWQLWAWFRGWPHVTSEPRSYARNELSFFFFLRGPSKRSMFLSISAKEKLEQVDIFVCPRGIRALRSSKDQSADEELVFFEASSVFNFSILCPCLCVLR